MTPHTHTSTREISLWRSSCLAAAKIRLPSQHAFVSQLFWLAHLLLHLDTRPSLSLSLYIYIYIYIYTPLSLTYSRCFLTLSEKMWANLLWSDYSKRTLPVPLALCIQNFKVSAIFLLLYKLAEWHFWSIEHISVSLCQAFIYMQRRSWRDVFEIESHHLCWKTSLGWLVRSRWGLLWIL